MRLTTSPKGAQAGFSVLELLIVLAVVAALLGIGASSLGGLRKQLTLEETAQTISQDVQRARAQSLSSNRCTAVATCLRVRITSPQSYVLEEFVGSWQVRQTRTFSPTLAVTNALVGDTLTFDTRGFADFNLNGAVAGELRVTDGKTTLRIIPSMVGASRIVKL